MELMKINEEIDSIVLKKFYVKVCDIQQISMSPNSLNIINFIDNELEIIDGFFSDSKYIQQYFNENYKIDSDSNISLLFESSNDFTNKFVIFKDIVTNKYYISSAIESTFSPSEPNDVINIATIQEALDFELTKNVRFYFTDQKDLMVSLNKTCLLQKVLKKPTNSNFWNILPLNPKYVLPTLTNPIDVNDFDTRLFFSHFASLTNFDFYSLKVLNDYNLPWDQTNEKIKELFTEIKVIKENQEKILSNFAGMTQEQIKTFKENVFSGTNVVDYTDYKITKFMQNSTLPKKSIEEFIKMCSGWLKSNFAIEQGYTNAHKFILPFYINFSGGLMYLKSNFYDFLIDNEKIYITSSFVKKYQDETINYPTVAKELKEVNIDLNWQKINTDYLKYKTYFLLNKPIENFDLNLYLDKSNKPPILKPYKETKIIELTSELITGTELDGAKIKEIFVNKYGNDWKIIDEMNIYEGEIEFSYLWDFHNKNNPKNDLELFRLIHFNYAKWNNPTAFYGTKNFTPIVLNKSWKSKGRYLTEWTYKCKVFKITFKAETTILPPENQDIPAFLNTLVNNNFNLSYTDFNYLANEIGELKDFNFDLSQNEQLVFQGLFLPETIKLNNEIAYLNTNQNSTGIFISFA
ncbi:hypothetical protein [Metamycoplasma buccale]|uniref:hypothetical protein n=1 Tax=Metamycoplasma buccale TaxID=55602 RepID=UPI00398F1FA0